MISITSLHRDLINRAKDAEKRISKILKVISPEEYELKKDLDFLRKELQAEAKFIRKEFSEENRIFKEFIELERAIESKNPDLIHKIASRLLKDLRAEENIEKHAVKIENRKALMDTLDRIYKVSEALINEVPQLKKVIDDIHRMHRNFLVGTIEMFKELKRYCNIPEIRALEKEIARLEKIEARISKVT